ncbi:MAG: cytochrome o ubiquinol oxidase subunit IV [Candidatus Liberibacter europaeus]|uniref:Cytochrome bo(3) ubiquinol oxidase subunit 4 n=1 Tax=Candidatus Liberibacter europaeus TaxID=744859 RepID=A0A2T4VZ90_9HYPH|nr:cytochrome o ubiquinol oxidase subunit IV [Candidatus Liberibacter europaeus]PTL87085.1 MAG: cytochrome o ubiquinol oxidase subunit IV [Candidatus Liberibacter europaeus]
MRFFFCVSYWCYLILFYRDKYKVKHNQSKTSYSDGSLGHCLSGFILSAVLTAIPFGVVMLDCFSDQQIIFLIIILCAIAQIFVHLAYFLHMKIEDRWSFIAMVFTIIIIAICFLGSVWVMYHLNNNMMPMGSMNSVH